MKVKWNLNSARTCSNGHMDIILHSEKRTKRRDKLMKVIDAQIKKKGEAEVIFKYTDPPKGLVITYDDAAP